MKKLKVLATAILMLMGIAASFAQTKTETIKVSGNCGSCKKHIEKAAKSAGAEKAIWDKETKVLSVTYDASKTSNDAIQKKIASVGYDTEKYVGDEKAYKNLDECCQYDEKRK
jgi:periplasmic mercuric ion binding protein